MYPTGPPDKVKPNIVKVAPTRSALKVLVNGAVPALRAVVPVELITVFTKLAPGLLVADNAASRFSIWPFGAFNTAITSPTYAWVIFNLTLILEITPPAGIPETAMFETPAVAGGAGKLPSGIGTLTVPDVKLAVVVDDVELVSLTAGSPRHITTGEGVILGAGGV